MFKRMFTENEINEIAKEASGDVVEISNITAIPTKVLNALKAGDTVVKITGNMKHSYRVSYKEDGQGICLTYTDASISETVSYDYVGTSWVYNSTDVTELNSGGSGDSALVLKVEMEGGTFTADEMTALVTKPYNVIIAAGEATGYMNPVSVSPHYNGETITSVDVYVLGSINPISFVKVEINVSTGVYTISMNV